MSDYCDSPPEAKSRPRVGTFLQPSVEKILALRPDLKVVLMTGYAQDPPQSLPRAIPTLHKPFNLDRLCEIAEKMLAEN